MKLWVPVIKFSLKPVELNKGRPAGGGNRYRFKKTYGLLAAAILVIGVITLAWRGLSSPGYGQVAVTTTDATPTIKVPEYTTLSTNYYSINYSGRYGQQPNELPPGGVLDQKMLTYKQSIVEIDIKAAPDGGITQDSTYIRYQKDSAHYKLTNKLYRGEIVDIARSTTGPPETAGLWLHGSYLMIVKLTSPDKSQDIDTELKDLLSSVQWKQ